MAFDKAKALQEAHKYVTQGKIAQAIKQYEWIVEMDPGDLTLLNVIGDLYVQENNLREALKYFYRLADAYTKEKYKVKAIAIYKKISKFDRGTAEPLLKLAELNAAQGFAREAREHYKNAFEFFERGNQKDKALVALRELCQLDPQSYALRLQFAQFADRVGDAKTAAGAYLEAAALAQTRGDISAAESALNKAGELVPASPDVHLCRAKLALANQKPAEVKAILDSVPELRAKPPAQRLLFDSYLASGDLDEARALLLEVFRSNPSDFSPVAEFASRCINRHQYNEILEVLVAIAPALTERRETGPLMETLRLLWKATPDHVDTLEFIYGVAEKTADEAVISEVLEALGDTYVRSDQLEKAELAYARLVAREPENEVYKDLLNQVLEKQGKEHLSLEQMPLTNVEVGLDAPPAAADSLSASMETLLAKPDAGTSHPPASVKIDLSQLAGGQGPQESETQLPPPKDICLEFQTSQGPERSAKSVPSSLHSHTADQTSHASAQHASSSDKASVFNYEESREEIEFYLRHAFYDEARKAVSGLEMKFPGENQVASLRKLIEEQSQRADAKSLADKTLEKEWELPTSFSESGCAGSPAGELREETGLKRTSEHLAGELASTHDNFDEHAKTASAESAVNAGGPGTRPPEDASAELGSLLDDLNDASEPIDQAADDDQTHYNLGVAFREMGLLDEAIGEFQKVVKDGGLIGYSPRFLQSCTLLAACFMDKGMPGIAAKWYSRALEAPGLGRDGMLALYYDMGVALEKAGNTEAALEKFTEVYSQNIDYREVAEKIRLLRKSAS